jgi:predicted secreted acid phosphatase
MAMSLKVVRVVLAGGLVLAMGWAVAAREPGNLSLLKAEIHAYVDTGAYDREIAAVAAQAGAWLEQRVKQGGSRLTIVFDLDETLLSNLPVMNREDFGYVPRVWDAWVGEGVAPVIAPVRELYRTARRLGVDVVFLTGRRESRDRPGTEKNLRAIGCGEYAALILKADASKENTGDFKLAQRRRLVAEGRVIIANIGDQDSDFLGGVAEKDFKVPDPFYLIK